MTVSTNSTSPAQQEEPQKTAGFNGVVVDTKEAEAISLRISHCTLIINIVLSLLKLAAGIFAKSGAMISDAIHTASDALSTIIVIISVKVSAKDSDIGHPYGHERFESLGSILLAVMLFGTGAWIGWEGLLQLMPSHKADLAVPGIAALLAAILSIIVKEWMFWYTIAAAKRVNSTALTADAWHHRSDAMSSVGALIGIGGARLGWPILDPLASVVISLMIMKTAYDIARDAADRLTDKSCDSETEARMQTIIAEQEGVLGVGDLKTRLFGARIFVDATIICDGSTSLYQAHATAELVHKAIEKDFPTVKHCNVHVDPDRRPEIS